jgi:hypothetical protein
MAERKELGVIEKNQLSKIIISLSPYKGKWYFDLREHIKTEKYEGPTKKGVTLAVEHFDEFKKIIEKLEKEIKKLED